MYLILIVNLRTQTKYANFKKLRLIVFFLLIIPLVKTFSQGNDKKRNNPWIIGVGVAAIDDSGNQLSRPFSFDDSYHFTSPYKFSIEKRFANDFGIEASTNFNTFLKGKLQNDGIIEESINFFAIDTSFKYYATNLFLDKYRSYFEGSLITGLGLSFYDNQGGANFNLGGGIAIYLSKRLRLVGQATAKIDISKLDVGSNYMQYDAGLIYRLPRN